MWCGSYVMGLASSGLGQLLLTTKGGIELVAFFLGAGVLPIGTVGMREGGGELILKRLGRIQAAKEILCFIAPVDTSMLLSRTADPLDPTEV